MRILEVSLVVGLTSPRTRCVATCMRRELAKITVGFHFVFWKVGQVRLARGLVTVLHMVTDLYCIRIIAGLKS